MPILPTQIAPLTPDDLPKDVRSWMDAGLLIPLNRLLDLLRSLISRGISIRTHINAQVIERKFIPPTASTDIADEVDWSTSRFDAPLTLSGPVLGVQVLAAYKVDGAGHDTGPVWNLPAPVWREVLVEGKRNLRLVYQFGLQSGQRYRLVLLAWGS